MAKRIAKKEVKITCETKHHLNLDELKVFQGKLKKLSEDSYERLKNSIIKLGFSFPVFVWKDKKNNWIIDATQRITALIRMRDEGWIIPKLPVVYVTAKSKKEAAEKVLAATSLYGEVTQDGLYSFMKDFGINLNDMKLDFNFSGIDFDSFESNYWPKTKEISFTVKEGSKELLEEDFSTFDHQCPKCGFKYNDK